MSRHQYVRNLDYQDAMDEYEGYSDEEDDELSPEDKALMSQGTAAVQAALGVEASKVTVAQIEEALWHYYYDVDKSVTYLTTKFINPRPKATKPAPPPQQPSGKYSVSTSHRTPPAISTELDIPACWTRDCLGMTDLGPPLSHFCHLNLMAPPQVSEQPSLSHLAPTRTGISSFFHDMPWGNIPKHRETIFIPPPVPRGGLLGGSGAPPKMSKLQALAAARKKKAEEKGTAQDKVEKAQTAVAKLSINDTPPVKEASPIAGAFGKRLKTSESTAQGRMPLDISEPTRSEAEQPIPETREPDSGPTPYKAEGSVFAHTLFGWEPDTSNRERKVQESYSLYPSLPQSVIDAFAKPSPDDVVFAAQAKGSLSGKGKR